MKTILKTVVAGVVLTVAGSAQAGVITNSSEIITSTEHQTLVEWLGEDFDLTLIFAKEDGDTADDWHAAVDNQGATFTIMEIINGDDVRIVGGYNIYDWDSTSAWLQSDSTENFLFNLTSGEVYEKNDATTFQTYNSADYAVGFGAGIDLLVNFDLTTGYANIGNSYGESDLTGSADYQASFTGTFNSWVIGSYETFTISESTQDFSLGEKNIEAEDVPVPLAFAGLGLIGLMGFRKKS